MWQKAESVQIHATSDCDARTTARNWRLSQSEALISCSRDTHATHSSCSRDTHAAVTARPIYGPKNIEIIKI